MPLEVSEFSGVFEGKTVFFQVLKLTKSFYLWIGDEKASFGSLCMAANNPYVSRPVIDHAFYILCLVNINEILTVVAFLYHWYYLLMGRLIMFLRVGFMYSCWFDVKLQVVIKHHGPHMLM